METFHVDFHVQHHQIRGVGSLMEEGITHSRKETCYVSHEVWNFREDGTNRFIFNGKIGAPVVKLIQRT